MFKVPSNCTTRDGELLRNGAVGLATKQRVLNFLPPIVIANAAFPRHESGTLTPAPVAFTNISQGNRLGIGVERFNCRMGGEFGYRFCLVGIANVQIYSPRRVRRVSGFRR